jgi:SAM-dependent methyltransferase
MFNNELKLFQRNETSIWTDDYLSKSLLKSHLDDYPDGASRKGKVFEDTLKWINSKINKNSKIIDFGCGPGLYSYRLGMLGHDVLGIDFNKESIRYAQENKIISMKTEFIYGNFLNESIDRKFDVAIFICFEFGALIPAEQILILNKIYNLLEVNGILLLDCFGEKRIEKEYKEGKNWHISNGGGFWSNEPYFLMEETIYYREEKAVGRRYYIVNQITKEIKEFILWDQYYDKNSIKTLIEKNGFKVLEVKEGIVEDGGLFITAMKN